MKCEMKITTFLSVSIFSVTNVNVNVNIILKHFFRIHCFSMCMNHICQFCNDVGDDDDDDEEWNL